MKIYWSEYCLRAAAGRFLKPGRLRSRYLPMEVISSGADERFAQPHRPPGVKVRKDLAPPEAQAKAMAGIWLFHGSTSYSRVLFLSN